MNWKNAQPQSDSREYIPINGTPDVVGVRESKRSDIIQFPTEIVVGEIKLTPTD